MSLARKKGPGWVCGTSMPTLPSRAIYRTHRGWVSIEMAYTAQAIEYLDLVECGTQKLMLVA